MYLWLRGVGDELLRFQIATGNAYHRCIHQIWWRVTIGQGCDKLSIGDDILVRCNSVTYIVGNAQFQCRICVMTVLRYHCIVWRILWQLYSHCNQHKQESQDDHSPSHDEGTRAHDAGTRAHDAGTRAHDAGTRAHDEGTRAHDEGSRAHDEGTRAHDDRKGHHYYT